ncbi:MAG: dihydrolipoamide acetyltransferase family protein [Acidimicrobiia bacterium]
MAFEFRLPDIGEGLVEAEIVGWRVGVGDTVERDQVVVDVETDKAVVEIPIPVAGTVLHLGGAEGETIEVGAILVVVGEADETWPAGDAGEGGSGEGDVDDEPVDQPGMPESGVSEPAEVAPIVGTLDSEVTMLSRDAMSGGGGDDRPKALPLVRKLARELGVDLRQVTGTGPDGRITRDDVTTAAEGPREPRVGGAPGGPRQPTVRSHGGDGRRMSATRRAIADRMSRSWSEIPHVTSFDEVDASRLLEVKRALERRTGQPMSIDALLVKAVVPVLESHPDFNARLEGDTLFDPPTIDVGVAVDTPDGLLVVVVRDAASASLSEVNGEITRLAQAARERKAAPSDLSGQTFTVSNIGAVGGGFGTPIVPYGTVGILSVGRAKERPVVRDGSVTVAPVMPLSLSYDHRVIDGAAGRRFLADVVENLSEPALFLAD